jgi:hypothetical protein
LADRRDESERYVGEVLAAIAAARAAGAGTDAEIAGALDARGITSRKGRRWTATAVAKFLASPGARRRGVGDGPKRG